MKTFIILFAFSQSLYSQEIIRDVRLTNDYYESYCKNNKRYLFRGYKSEKLIEDCSYHSKKCSLIYSGPVSNQIIRSVCR